jgi:hypothetical protein
MAGSLLGVVSVGVFALLPASGEIGGLHNLKYRGPAPDRAIVL